ncbi:MAG: hypothetical protein EOP21_01695 [Hyphomicrobiales bacterium]|nr:MAG: hypothetical protein EOP21_01695 [Hyphomicrobiales bacterium]
MSRVFPAAFSASAGLVATGGVFVGIGLRAFTVTAVSLAIAALFGALSLWLSLRRSQGMELDIKPTPLN